MKYDFHIYFIITYENHISLNLGKSKLSIKYFKKIFFFFFYKTKISQIYIKLLNGSIGYILQLYI